MSESKIDNQSLIANIIVLMATSGTPVVKKAVGVIVVVLCMVVNSMYKSNCEKMSAEFAAVRIERSKLNPQGVLQHVKNLMEMHGFLYNTFGRLSASFIPKKAMLAYMALAQLEELSNCIADGQLDNTDELIEKIQKNISISKDCMPDGLKVVSQTIEAKLKRLKYLIELKICVDSKLMIISTKKALNNIIALATQEAKNSPNAKYACSDLYPYYMLLTQLFEDTIVPYEEVNELKASIKLTYKKAEVKHVKRIDDLIERIDNITEASMKSKKQMFDDGYRKAKRANKAKKIQDAVDYLMACYALAPDNPSVALALARLQLKLNEKEFAGFICNDMIDNGNEKIVKIFTPLLEKCR